MCVTLKGWVRLKSNLSPVTSFKFYQVLTRQIWISIKPIELANKGFSKIELLIWHIVLFKYKFLHSLIFLFQLTKKENFTLNTSLNFQKNHNFSKFVNFFQKCVNTTYDDISHFIWNIMVVYSFICPQAYPFSRP